jgi:hypothetical protein
MRERRQIVCLHAGVRRAVFPVCLGFTRNIEKALVFEPAGGGDEVTAADGTWRCLALAGVRILEMRESAWRVPDHREPGQTCIADVECDLDPRSSPPPRYRL